MGDDRDVEKLEEVAQPKKRELARLIYRATYGADYCWHCNKPLGPTDPLDYACSEHSAREIN